MSATADKFVLTYLPNRKVRLYLDDVDDLIAVLAAYGLRVRGFSDDRVLPLTSAVTLRALQAQSVRELRIVGTAGESVVLIAVGTRTCVEASPDMADCASAAFAVIQSCGRGRPRWVFSLAPVFLVAITVGSTRAVADGSGELLGELGQALLAGYRRLARSTLLGSALLGLVLGRVTVSQPARDCVMLTHWRKESPFIRYRGEIVVAMAFALVSPFLSDIAGALFGA